jgi:hypothetical protein
MPAVCIGRHATGRSPEHTQNRRLVIGFRRQKVETSYASQSEGSSVVTMIGLPILVVGTI